MATFSVPNEASASYTDQAELDAMDLQIIVNGFAGTGVYSGCLVTAQGSPDDTVAVSSGSYRIGGSTKTCAGGTVNVISGSANPDGSTTSAANASYYRYDLIVANSSSQLGVLHGTVPAPAWPDYNVNPVFPTVTTSYAVLAAILIPPTAASISGISSSQIIPKNLALSVDALHDQAHSISGANHTGDVATTQMPQLSAWSTYMNATSSTADPTTAIIPYTQVLFAKQGVVAVTTEGDTPPPFRWYNRTGRTLTFHSASANATIGPSGATMTIDVNVDGTTIMTGTKVVLADSTGAAGTVTQTTFSTATVADGHYVSVNVDSTGGGAVQNLLVTLMLKG
jgi:hypothetical protein